MTLLKEIDAKKAYKIPVKFLGASLIGPSFCLMFNGDFFDCLSCLIAVLATYALSFLIDKVKFNDFIRIFICCGFAALVALMLKLSGLTGLIGPVIIGSVTMFLPGVAITNSARDLLSGEMLAGMARGTEAIISAVAIASGVGIVLQLWQSMGGVL